MKINVLVLIFLILTISLYTQILFDGEYTAIFDSFDYLGCKQSLKVVINDGKIMNVAFTHNWDESVDIKGKKISIINELKAESEIAAILSDDLIKNQDKETVLLIDALYTSYKYQILLNAIYFIAAKAKQTEIVIPGIDTFCAIIDTKNDAGYYPILIVKEKGKSYKSYQYNEINEKGKKRSKIAKKYKKAEDLHWYELIEANKNLGKDIQELKADEESPGINNNIKILTQKVVDFKQKIYGKE